MLEDIDALIAALLSVRDEVAMVAQDRDHARRALGQLRHAADEERQHLEGERNTLAEHLRVALLKHDKDADTIQRLTAQLDRIKTEPKRVEDAERRADRSDAQRAQALANLERLEQRLTASEQHVAELEEQLRTMPLAAQSTIADQLHRATRRAERAENEAQRLAQRVADLTRELQAAQDQAEQSRRAILDHAART